MRQACKTGRINQVSIVVERARAWGSARTLEAGRGAPLQARPRPNNKSVFFEEHAIAITTKFNRILLDSQWGSQSQCLQSPSLVRRDAQFKLNDSASPVRLFRTSSQAWTPRDRGRSDNFEIIVRLWPQARLWCRVARRHCGAELTAA